MNTPSPQTNQNPQPTKHDIYTDPALAQAPTDDPLYKWLNAHWRHLLSLVIAIAVITYFVGAFRDSYESSMRGAADIYARLQSEYNNYSVAKSALSAAVIENDKKMAGKSAAEKNEAEKGLENYYKNVEDAKSRLTQLVNSASYTREPYSVIADLYRGLMQRIENPKSPDLAALDKFRDWENVGKPNSDQRFYAELGALILARAYLDDATKRTDGEAMLKNLATKSQIVNVSAALTLSHIADTKEKRVEAKQILDTVLSKNPEQLDLVSDESKRLSKDL